MKYSLYIAIFLIACNAQQMDDCITAAGTEQTISRELGAFHGILTGDKFQLYLVQDSSLSGRVEITGPSNLLDQIQTEVKDGLLELSNGNTCNFVRNLDIRFNIRVFVGDLKSLHVTAASNVFAEDSLHLSSLKIIHEGLSDVDLVLVSEGDVYVNSFNSAHTRLRGRAKALKGSIEEVSDLNALDLECEEVLLDLHSPWDCYIDATEIIFVKIYNKGNIYYKREPRLYKDLNVRKGTGNLILLP